MLQLNNVAVSYDKPVLHDVSLRIETSSVHGIVGLNGSGKTTLMNALAQRLSLDSGSIELNGVQLAPGEVGYLETENFFYPRITAREYVSIFMLANKSFDLEGWNTLLELPLDSLIDDFSTGMKKKTALLGLLCQNRPLLLLDEPFNGLDLETGQILKVILEKLQTQGKTIVLTSHILETLTSTCTAISHLHAGKLAQTWQRDEFSRLEGDIFKDAHTAQSALVEQLLKGNG